MKAIILAAGLGTRLGEYTQNKPKCMLEFLGKPLIEWQIEKFRRFGIEDIVIIKGHFGEKINLPDIKFVEWSGPETNMVIDFFEARREFFDDVILSYGDILFEDYVLKKVVESDAEVGVVVDEGWKDYWVERYGNWLDDSESMILKVDDIISLGKSNPLPDEMHARYIGLIKFSKSVFPSVMELYDKSMVEYWDKPWYNAPSFKKAYMTDFIQALIDESVNVKAIKINKGWLEFDTKKDYELSLDWVKNETLNRF